MILHKTAPSPLLLMLCGIIGIAGAVALVLGNIVGSMMVPGHDWIADTVSDLAAGKNEIIQDVTLYAYAAGLLACAIGAAHYHLGDRGWTAGILGLALLALCVVIIGVRNEYGDGDDEGIVVHVYVVYVIGILFAAVPMLMAQGMGRVSGRAKAIAWGCALLWSAGAPVFFFLPTDIDGVWERGLGIITVVFVGTLSLLLYRAGRGASDPSHQARNAVS